MSEQYNGWTNKQTWLVFSWITKDERDYLSWTQRARSSDEYDLSQQIRNAVEEGMPDLPGLYTALLNGALDEVNWREVAKSFMEK